MIPISDDNPGQHPPFINWAIMAGCIGVFFWQLTLPAGQDELIYKYAFTPLSIFGAKNGIPDMWALATLFTSLFLHSGWLHLGGNMLYLWIFGNNVEDAMGHFTYLVFYLICGAGACAAMGLSDPTSSIPTIGASGAISGVLAAYVLVFPRAKVTVIIPLGIILYPMKISAFYVILFWFLLQLFSVWIADPDMPGIAWGAHIGGFLTGFVLTPFFSRFPLFGRVPKGPWG